MVGVELERGGRELFADARIETVLAAGAIGSPQILQLSGIGPGQLLQELGIPVACDLTGVGDNLQDHLQLRMAFKVQHARTLNQLTNNEVSQTWDQPFAPQTLGYQKNPGFPTYDPKKAEDYVNKYKQETGQSSLSFTVRSTPDPATVR